jgi:hypothetical protein
MADWLRGWQQSFVGSAPRGELPEDAEPSQRDRQGAASSRRLRGYALS